LTTAGSLADAARYCIASRRLGFGGGSALSARPKSGSPRQAYIKLIAADAVFTACLCLCNRELVCICQAHRCYAVFTACLCLCNRELVCLSEYIYPTPVSCSSMFVTAGNLRTQDFGGPYNLTLLTTQEAEIKSELLSILALCLISQAFWLYADQLGVLAPWVIAQSFTSNTPTAVFDILHVFFAGGIAAKQNYTDADIINFLTNVECLEGQFDTWGAFGFGFVGKSKPLRCSQGNLEPHIAFWLCIITISMYEWYNDV